MREKDLRCYEVNYEVEAWQEAFDRDRTCPPVGAVYAIRALIAEVRRLRKALRRKR